MSSLCNFQSGIFCLVLICSLLTTLTRRFHFSLCCLSPHINAKVVVRPLGTEVIMLVNDCVLVILINYLSHWENNITHTGSAWQHAYSTPQGQEFLHKPLALCDRQSFTCQLMQAKNTTSHELWTLSPSATNLHADSSLSEAWHPWLWFAVLGSVQNHLQWGVQNTVI